MAAAAGGTWGRPAGNQQVRRKKQWVAVAGVRAGCMLRCRAANHGVCQGRVMAARAGGARRPFPGRSGKAGPHWRSGDCSVNLGKAGPATGGSSGREEIKSEELRKVIEREAFHTYG